MTDSLMLSFERTVPCSLAHRRAIGEVFVTDTAEAGPDEYVAAVQIPRAHLLWFDRCAEYHDPLSMVEAIRQAVIVLGHRYLGVPAGTPVSLQSIEVTVEDISAFRDARNVPLEGIARIRLTPPPSSHLCVGESSFDASLTIEGSLALTIRGRGAHFPADVYRQLRIHQQATRPADNAGDHADVERAHPATVGRTDRRNVVVGAEPVRCGPDGTALIPLVVDQRHPAFFDHPYDHVPGPLLLEGCRQAAILAAVDAEVLDSPVVALTSCAMTFDGFAELGPPVGFSVAVFADPDSGGATVELAAYQFGQRIGLCSLELSPHPQVSEHDEQESA